MCQLMILGWCTVRLLLSTEGGLPCPGFFGGAADSRSVLDSESATSEDLGGAGITGDMTGMAARRFTTTTPTSPAAERLSIAATSTTATSIMAISVTATRSTGLRPVTVSHEHAPARSVALITWANSEAFPPEGGRALELAASREVVPIACGGGRR